jgi:hypothetical protein
MLLKLRYCVPSCYFIGRYYSLAFGEHKLKRKDRKMDLITLRRRRIVNHRTRKNRRIHSKSLCHSVYSENIRLESDTNSKEVILDNGVVVSPLERNLTPEEKEAFRKTAAYVGMTIPEEFFRDRY